MPRWISNRRPFLSAAAIISAPAVVLLSMALLSAGLLNAAYRAELRDGEFRLQGWNGGAEPPSAGWESVFAIYAGGSRTPMLGSYSVEGGALVFHPRFPLAGDTGYRVQFPGGGMVIDTAHHRVLAARVVNVYPSGDVLPSNTLRLYIYFSAPMSAGDASGHLKLLDEAGNPLAGAFLALDQELWDPDHRRLTVLFDPGRIKRGLVPARQAGSPIVEGRRYKLAIDRGWHDARGGLLVDDFAKRFTGGAPDRTPASPKKWRLDAPKSNTWEPLIVDFPKAMDYALLERLLDVPGVPGKVTIARNETEWSFKPDAAWKPGSYQLHVGSELEDICGNHLDRPFDVDLRINPATVPSSAHTISIPFRVR